MDKHIEAEIEDILLDISRYTKKVDKTSLTEIKKYLAKAQECIDRLANIVKVADFL